MPGFFLLLNSYLHRAVKILFLSFTCEDIGVAMVTNIITNIIVTFWNRKYKY